MSTPIRFEPSRVTQASGKEWAIRFVFGGVVTAGAGAIAAAFGPEVGGLFLAFPAILPASLTLVRKKDGKPTAGADSLGASVGAVGLFFFGLLIWILARHTSAAGAIVAATGAWLVISATIWWLIVLAGRAYLVRSSTRGLVTRVARNRGAPSHGYSNRRQPRQ